MQKNLKGDDSVGNVTAIKEGFEEIGLEKVDLTGTVPSKDQSYISKLNNKLNDCTKKINDAIDRGAKKKEIIAILKEFTKELGTFLDNMSKEQELERWNYYRICKLLEMAVTQWCTSAPIFSKEIILYILTGLTGTKWQSLRKINSSEEAKINIKESDKSMTGDVEKSLQNFATALVRIYFYYVDKKIKKIIKKIEDEDKKSKGEIKEFKREEIPSPVGNDPSEDSLGKGGTGSVRKIQYIGKDSKTKTRAIKTIGAQFFKEGDKSKGLEDYAQAFVEGSRTVENSFEKFKQEYKEAKKRYEELKGKAGDDNEKFQKLQLYNEAKNRFKSKFSNLALQKVRTIGNEVVMISKLAQGNLMDFFIKKHEYKLDNRKKIYKLFGDLTAGVSQLHEMGLVHGDIKPENILVYKTKKGGLKYKITDFDSVVRVENYKDNALHTTKYLPECYIGKNRIPNGYAAKKVDCYAICMTLREVFSSIENFGGKNPQSLQKYAESLVAKYEKKHSCSEDSFKQELSPKESSSLNS